MNDPENQGFAIYVCHYETEIDGKQYKVTEHNLTNPLQSILVAKRIMLLPDAIKEILPEGVSITQIPTIPRQENPEDYASQ